MPVKIRKQDGRLVDIVMTTMSSGLTWQVSSLAQSGSEAGLPRSDQEKLGLAQSEKESWEGIRDSDIYLRTALINFTTEL